MLDPTPTYLEERADLTRRVKQMLVQQLNLQQGRQQIDLDAPLFGRGLGLDSVDALEVIVGLEQEFDVVVPEDQKAVLHSVNAVVDHLLVCRARQEQA